MIAIGAATAAAGVGAAYASYLNSENGGKEIWKAVLESKPYSFWRNMGRWVIAQQGGVHKPVDANGNNMNIPSTSPPVYLKPPNTFEECKSLQPQKLRGLTLRNAVMRAAAFDGERTEEIASVHAALAAGGVGLSVMAYCSVSSDGRTFAGQVVMDDQSRSKLKFITDAVHKNGGRIACQLTHAGSFADRSVIGKQQIAPSAVFNPAGIDFPRPATKKDIARLLDDFENAARIGIECGFDAVEVHCGHGYMLSQWMSPFTNVRTDEYGGSAENRARFPAECIRRVRKAVGENVPILVKMNMHDGHSGGLELGDSLIMADIFADASADVIVCTGGQVARNAFYMLRGNVPLEKLAQALPSPLEKFCTALFGPLAVPELPYEACFLRESARAVLAKVGHKTKVCLMGGVNSLGAMEGAIAEGFSFVQMARTLIREPDFLLRVEREMKERSKQNVEERDEAFDVETKCIQCNMCVVATVDPSAPFGCPFRQLEEKHAKASLSLNQTSSKMLLPDIEDIMKVSPKL